MKKGISLIVLVITIIVMIIIAGAIIISLNSSNVIGQANEAVEDSNTANARSIVALKYAELMSAWYADHPTEKFDPSTGVDEINAALDNVNKAGSHVYTVAENSTNDGYVLILNGVTVQD